jgi:putative peptide zinc metalloprotease protein
MPQNILAKKLLHNATKMLHCKGKIMGSYRSETLVTVHPFTRQVEDDEVVIGHLDTAIFLVLPTDAVEILDDLAKGRSIGEVQSIYGEKYGEIPDLEDLLSILEAKGFVQPLNPEKIWESKPGHSPDQISSLNSNDGHLNSHPAIIQRLTKPSPVRYHFEYFPQSVARKIFSRAGMLIWSSIVGLALIAIVAKPSLLPNWEAYFFKDHATLMILALMGLDCVTLFLHEMAHLVAARSLGVSCRMGISHRMWMLVAETDMTGIWSVPRQKRYLPFLAGVLLDVVCAAILVLIFFADLQGWILLPPVVFQLGRALLLNYFLGLLWQCYFFLRTDFYYIIATFLKCKNLMKDTEVFLWNKLGRLIHSIRQVDQSHIPRRERRVIAGYSLLWLIGRTAALGSFCFIILPVTWHYFIKLSGVLSAGYFANPSAFIDALLMIMMVCIPQSLGLWLWFQSFRTTRRQAVIVRS